MIGIKSQRDTQKQCASSTAGFAQNNNYTCFLSEKRMWLTDLHDEEEWISGLHRGNGTEPTALLLYGQLTGCPWWKYGKQHLVQGPCFNCWTGWLVVDYYMPIGDTGVPKRQQWSASWQCTWHMTFLYRQIRSSGVFSFLKILYFFFGNKKMSTVALAGVDTFWQTSTPTESLGKSVSSWDFSRECSTYCKFCSNGFRRPIRVFIAYGSHSRSFWCADLLSQSRQTVAPQVAHEMVLRTARSLFER